VKVTVDVELCAGHGACMVTCPSVFTICDDGYAEVLVDTVPVELEAQVQRAERECPTQAISIATE